MKDERDITQPDSLTPLEKPGLMTQGDRARVARGRENNC